MSLNSFHVSKSSSTRDRFHRFRWIWRLTSTCIAIFPLLRFERGVPGRHTHAAFALSPSLSFFNCSLGGSTSGPKLRGNSSPIVLTINLPSLLNMKIGVSKFKNSLKNCLHIPHGEQKSSISVATPTALKEPSLCPWMTAVPNATRSAQVPTG